MSTDKVATIEEILQRLKFAKKFNTWKEVCGYLGVAEGVLSAWRSRNSPSAREKILFRSVGDVNTEYLLTGQGPMLVADKPIETDNAEPIVKTTENPETNEEEEQGNVPMQEALDMTEAVLLSKTVYKSALWSNIRAFHKAVLGESEMDDLRKEVGEIKKMLALLIERSEGSNAKRGFAANNG